MYDGRETSNLNATQKILVERYYKDFVRAGALLSEADKEQLKTLIVQYKDDEALKIFDSANWWLASNKSKKVSYFK